MLLRCWSLDAKQTRNQIKLFPKNTYCVVFAQSPVPTSFYRFRPLPKAIFKYSRPLNLFLQILFFFFSIFFLKMASPATTVKNQTVEQDGLKLFWRLLLFTLVEWWYFKDGIAQRFGESSKKVRWINRNELPHPNGLDIYYDPSSDDQSCERQYCLLLQLFRPGRPSLCAYG